jgi:hypothetical protein
MKLYRIKNYIDSVSPSRTQGAQPADNLQPITPLPSASSILNSVGAAISLGIDYVVSLTADGESPSIKALREFYENLLDRDMSRELSMGELFDLHKIIFYDKTKVFLSLCNEFGTRDQVHAISSLVLDARKGIVTTKNRTFFDCIMYTENTIELASQLRRLLDYDSPGYVESVIQQAGGVQAKNLSKILEAIFIVGEYPFRKEVPVGDLGFIISNPDPVSTARSFLARGKKAARESSTTPAASEARQACDLPANNADSYRQLATLSLLSDSDELHNSFSNPSSTNESVAVIKPSSPR